MEKKNIIVIGASAGGFEALKTLVAGLPPDLDAAIFIVWHQSPEIKGILPQILNGQNTVPAAHATDKDPLLFNRIYVARPDMHLIIEDGLIRVTRGPKENRFRPAVDPLFRSAAFSYGPRVIGVILSGSLDDGTAGLWNIKNRGGTTIVQSDAEVSSMPQNAADKVKIDHAVPVSEMGALLGRLASEDAPDAEEISMSADEHTGEEIAFAKLTHGVSHGEEGMGPYTPYACPECHGVLSALYDGRIMRFRCHTGHAYSDDTLLVSITENIEQTLWGAFRGMEEAVILLNNLGDHYAEINRPKRAAVYFIKAKEIRDRASIIQGALASHEQLTTNSINFEADGSGDN